MNIVPLTGMSANHVRRYSRDRNFLGNIVDPDQILHYAPFDPCADPGFFQGGGPGLTARKQYRQCCFFVIPSGSAHVHISLIFGLQTARGQLDFQFLAQEFQIEEGGSQDFLIQNVSGSTAGSSSITGLTSRYHMIQLKSDNGKLLLFQIFCLPIVLSKMHSNEAILFFL